MKFSTANRPASLAPRGAGPQSTESIPMKNLVNFLSDESGATAIEYGLLAALISVMIIGGATLVGTSLNGTFTSVSGSLK